MYDFSHLVAFPYSYYSADSEFAGSFPEIYRNIREWSYRSEWDLFSPKSEGGSLGSVVFTVLIIRQTVIKVSYNLVN